MTISYRRPEPDDAPGMVRLFTDVMNQSVPDDRIDDETRHLELDRSWLAEDAFRLVGTITGHSFEMTVPGGALVPMAGLTLAAVAPSHRRRGILTELVTRFHADAEARGEPLAGLFSSDAAIYGRFGYGAATRFASVTIERDRVGSLAHLDLPGSCRWLRAADAVDEVAVLFERTRPARSGEIRRPRHILEGLLRRAGKSGTEVFTAIHDGPDGPDGYVVYRVESRWVDHTARNVVHVVELVGEGTVRVALWRFLLELDLARTVADANARVEEPIRDLLRDPRQLQITGVFDQLQLKILDPSRALAARTYNRDGHVSLAIDGATYELTVEGGKADVGTTRAEADVNLGPSALAMTYLGDRTFRSLAESGLVRADKHAAALADAMFSVSPSPQCLTLF